MVSQSPQILVKKQKQKTKNIQKHLPVHCLDVQSPLFTKAILADTTLMRFRLKLKPCLYACCCSVTKRTQLI